MSTEDYTDRDKWPDESLLLRYGAALERPSPRWTEQEDIQDMHDEILRRMRVRS